MIFLFIKTDHILLWWNSYFLCDTDISLHSSVFECSNSSKRCENEANAVHLCVTIVFFLFVLQFQCGVFFAKQHAYTKLRMETYEANGMIKKRRMYFFTVLEKMGAQKTVLLLDVLRFAVRQNLSVLLLFMHRGLGKRRFGQKKLTRIWTYSTRFTVTSIYTIETIHVFNRFLCSM